MNRSSAWTTLPGRITAWLSCWLVAWCGCAQWPGAPPAPDLTRAGGSRLEMGQMSERLGRADLAEKFYRDVLAQQPNQPLAHHRLAALAARDGRWQEADEHFRLARRSGPPTADLLTDLAYAQYQRRQIRAAECTLRQALEIDPQHAKSRSLLALVLNEQGRFREGLAEFRQAVRGIEGQGGAPDAYGAAIVAGSPPAPPPSGERTDRQLAAAGVRRLPSDHESPGDSLEEAEERSFAGDATPPPAKAHSVRSAKLPADAGQRSPERLKAASSARDRVAAKPAPSHPPRTSVSAAARGLAEHSVIVRLDPTDFRQMPTTAAAKPTANRSDSVAHRAGESADHPSRSRAKIKDVKKVGAEHTHEQAAEKGEPAPLASQVAAGDRATEPARNSTRESQGEKDLAETAPPGDTGAPALIAPGGSIAAERAGNDVSSEEERPVSVARSSGDSLVKKEPRPEATIADRSQLAAPRSVDADRPVLARTSARQDEHPSTVVPNSPPMDRGVLSRSSRRSGSSSAVSARGTTAADKRQTSAADDSTSPSPTRLASFEAEAAETPSGTRSAAEPRQESRKEPRQAQSPSPAPPTAAPPAETTKAKPPVPTTPAMSLPVGLDFSLPVRATPRPAPSTK